MARGHYAAALVAASALAGCYHFRFQHEGPAAAGTRLVTYSERVPTYLNGFVGTGVVDVSEYCEEPVHTDLRVTAADVALSVVTLLIYTPHTLYVTCEEPVPPPEAELASEG